jgi:hypothetical protein
LPESANLKGASIKGPSIPEGTTVDKVIVSATAATNIAPGTPGMVAISQASMAPAPEEPVSLEFSWPSTVVQMQDGVQYLILRSHWPETLVERAEKVRIAAEDQAAEERAKNPAPAGPVMYEWKNSVTLETHNHPENWTPANLDWKRAPTPIVNPRPLRDALPAGVPDVQWRQDVTGSIEFHPDNWTPHDEHWKRTFLPGEARPAWAPPAGPMPASPLPADVQWKNDVSGAIENHPAAWNASAGWTRTFVDGGRRIPSSAPKAKVEVTPALTVRLPPNPVDGQLASIFSDAGIMLLTVEPNKNQVLEDEPLAVEANCGIGFIYSASDSTWDRCR